MITTLAANAVPVRGRRTALVVDDVEDMLDLLEIALDGAGFAVLKASSVPEALELFQHHGQELDLLMADVRLGSDNGLELAQCLQSVKPSLQVLAISGFAPDRRLVKPRHNIHFLAKPFSASELKQKLATIFPVPETGLIVSVAPGTHGNYRVSTTCVGLTTDSKSAARDLPAAAAPQLTQSE